MIKQLQLDREVAALNLSPMQKEYLSAALSTYANLKFDVDALTHQMEIEKLTIGKVLEEAGIDKAALDEFNLCWVRGATTSKLDIKKLIAQGVTMAQIEMATTVKPKKVHFRISGKSERPDDEYNKEA